MNVALLGLGNVGRAVFDILSKKEADIFKNYEVNVKYVLVRNVENKDIDEVQALLAGIRCRNNTSCPDQLSQAIAEYKASKAAENE